MYCLIILQHLIHISILPVQHFFSFLQAISCQDINRIKAKLYKRGVFILLLMQVQTLNLNLNTPYRLTRGALF